MFIPGFSIQGERKTREWLWWDTRLLKRHDAEQDLSDLLHRLLPDYQFPSYNYIATYLYNSAQLGLLVPSTRKPPKTLAGDATTRELETHIHQRQTKGDGTPASAEVEQGTESPCKN